MRVLTLNTWKCDGHYSLRLQAMAEGIRALDPDVVALQECFVSVDGQHDTVRFLAQALGMHAHWTPARRKTRLLGGVSVDSWSGMAVLSRRPVIQGTSLQLPSNLADGGRLAQIALLPFTAETTWVLANVHLSHLSLAEGGGELRMQQLQAVSAHLKSRCANLAQLVCGDFNAPASALMPPDAPAWVDVCQQVGLTHKVTHVTENGEPRDLDQMLCNPLLAHQAVSAQVVLTQPEPKGGVLSSDHFGLLATFNPE